MTDLTPREIVSELDRFIIGQDDAKRAVAVALRNRWRRKQLPDDIRDEVYPKNILMIGPTGVGKTEISRRLAKLAKAPFLKVEATKFTEVGYVGRDVEQIVRDLVDAAVVMVREDMRERVKARAHEAAENRVIDALAGDGSRDQTREMFRRKLRSGELDDKEIELEVADTSSPFPMMEIPGQPGHGHGRDQPRRHLRQGVRRRRKVRRRMRVAASYELLITEEADKLLDHEAVNREAIDGGRAERHRLHRRDRQGRARAETRGADVSPRGRAARPAAADRGHHGLDQVRAGEDRPHPLHRLGRLPHRQALGPAARAAGPAADPGRAPGADRGRLRPHPDRDRQRADPAVRRADADRGGRRSTSPTTASPRWRGSPPR